MRGLAFVLFASLTFVVGGCSGGGGGGCGVAGQPCSAGSCCGTLQCINGVCAQGGMCAQSGQSCSSTACCQGLDCVNGTCQQQQQCASTGQSCANATCCQGLQCSNGTCQGQDTRKPFGGAPCTANNDCMTNLCIGTSASTQMFCSAACTSSAQCAALSQNPAYWCVQGNGADFCLRQCGSSADCASIGSDWTCDVGSDTEGLLHGLCGVYKNLAEGVVCTENSQCGKADCNGAWCSGPCFHDTDCGQYAVCLLTNNASYRCFPKCTTGNDCNQYNLSGLTTTCKSATTVDNAAVTVCSS